MSWCEDWQNSMGDWKFEVKTITPDGNVLGAIGSANAMYMDGSLMEHYLRDVCSRAVDSLRAAGYFH